MKSHTYRIECDADFSNIPTDAETGMFGDIPHSGLTLADAERNKLILDTTGDWPDGRPTYTIVPEHPEYITVCLIGDDRAHDYPVSYFGMADFPRWLRDDESACVGEIPVALLLDQDHEALVALHPDYGWCSAHDEFCRDFEPAISQSRLDAAR